MIDDTSTTYNFATGNAGSAVDAGEPENNSIAKGTMHMGHSTGAGRTQFFKGSSVRFNAASLANCLRLS